MGGALAPIHPDAHGLCSTVKIQSRLVPAFPRLGWLAILPRDGGDVTAFHGAGVETCDTWLVEGVWDGRFENGDFHRSEAFFGSGVRIDGTRVIASASTALVDRLLYCSSADQVTVSNSLALLLAFTDARLDIGHDYRPDCSASLQGIFGQPRAFRVAHPTITAFQQLYHGNLVVSQEPSVIELRSGPHRFDTFDAYVDRLRATLLTIKGNYESSRRMAPMPAFTTLSSGYDSTAVSCLAREVGVNACFTTRAPGGGAGLEDGAAVAAALGLTPHCLSLPTPAVGADERHFIAPSMWGSEIVFRGMAERIEAGGASAVVFTGYHGDKVWDAHIPAPYLRDDILRGDTSGLNLSEIRLKSGFINLAVPFLFARNIAHIAAISRSPDMAPWRLQTSYDRPIPRRIGETAGIPRTAFGQRKRVVMTHYNYPWNGSLREEFLRWLRVECAIGRSRVGAYEALDRLGSTLGRAMVAVGCGDDLALRPQQLKRLALPGRTDLRQLMFKWAASSLADEYRRILPRR